MYFRVPVVDGALDIDYSFLIEARLTDSIGVVMLRDGFEVRASWQQISETDYLAAFNAGRLQTNKTVVTANGLDTATVVAEVHSDLAEITFYHADTGEVITTVPVDPTTCTATLQVTATTPGVVRIRAGEPTITRLNEVVITAQ